VRTKVRIHEYPDGAVSIHLGPHRLADYDATGAMIAPQNPRATRLRGERLPPGACPRRQTPKSGQFTSYEIRPT